MKNKKAFTLIELLIVIAIIAIIAGIVFVALDPAKRFKDARDSRRWADISALMTAIKVYQVDNGGSLPAELASTTVDTVYMLGATSTLCQEECAKVSTGVGCVNLQELVDEGYLGSVPTNPDGATDWSGLTGTTTGYVIERAASGILTITSCDAESDSIIQVVR